MPNINDSNNIYDLSIYYVNQQLGNVYKVVLTMFTEKLQKYYALQYYRSTIILFQASEPRIL